MEEVEYGKWKAPGNFGLYILLRRSFTRRHNLFTIGAFIISHSRKLRNLFTIGALIFSHSRELQNLFAMASFIST